MLCCFKFVQWTNNRQVNTRHLEKHKLFAINVLDLLLHRFHHWVHKRSWHCYSVTIATVSETIVTVSATIATVSATIATVSETIATVSETIATVSGTIASSPACNEFSCIYSTPECPPPACCYVHWCMWYDNVKVTVMLCMRSCDCLLFVTMATNTHNLHTHRFHRYGKGSVEGTLRR